MLPICAALLTLSGARELVLGDFEGSVEGLFQANTGGTRFEVVREHATKGEFSLKVTCTGQYPGLLRTLSVSNTALHGALIKIYPSEFPPATG